jgi:hypothetical protein
MSTTIRYEVTIRTDCKACAMAIAGQTVAAARVKMAWVTQQEVDSAGQPVDREDNHRWTIHANAPAIQSHDGSPMFCPDHGKALDLSKPHPEAKS